MLHCGIIGLPLSGKTTIFNVITKAGALVKPYAGGKTDPNKAVVSVPDERFDKLSAFHQPKKETPAQVEFVDLAGISKNASKGAGLGNGFLSFAAEADALIQVIRGFDNRAVEHPESAIDLYRDFEIIETELIFRDLSVIENRTARLSSKKKITPEEEKELALLKKCNAHLLEEKPLRSMEISAEDEKMLRGFTFLSAKPQIAVINIDDGKKDEKDLKNIKGFDELCKKLTQEGIGFFCIYGSLEMDLAEMTPEEGAEFTQGLTIDQSARELLISQAYKLLGLISFFTCGPDEVRAWTLRMCENAIAAAGAIHSDLARGFIRAQVVGYSDYERNKFSFPDCRDAGCLRLEGKDYIVKDGDIIEIRFNV